MSPKQTKANACRAVGSADSPTHPFGTAPQLSKKAENPRQYLSFFVWGIAQLSFLD
jgi:hypothetical protein